METGVEFGNCGDTCDRWGLLEADVELESGAGGVCWESTPRKRRGREQVGGRDKKPWTQCRQGLALEQVLDGVRVTQGGS